MAYKEESYEQFLETLSAQIGRKRKPDSIPQFFDGSMFPDRSLPNQNLNRFKLDTLGPNPQNVYHGNDHPDQDDEDRIHPNNQAHFIRSLSGRNAKWDETPEEDEDISNPQPQPAMSPTARSSHIDDLQDFSPVMKNMRFKGGYSTDAGRFPQNKKTAPISSVGLEPRIEMRNVKREIEETEKKLHELQQQKVKLMRQLTGRL